MIGCLPNKDRRTKTENSRRKSCETTWERRLIHGASLHLRCIEIHVIDGVLVLLKKKKVVQTTKPRPSLERFSGPLYTMISLARLCETLKFD